MVKSVTVTNYLGESITLELAFPEKSGFVVQSITGLGPSKASINSTDLANADGSLYNSARVNPRNIVMSLAFLGTPTIEDTRQKSYKYFPIKKPITILMETDNRLCEAYGYVEANEPNIFSKDEGTQISIVCPDPYFYSAGDDGTKVTVFSGITPMFEFPFSNESTSSELIIVGEIIPNREQVVYYTGDAEIGIVIIIHALGPATNLAIYNSVAREVMRIDTDRLAAMTGNGIIAGDDIVISTVKGKKKIQLFRDGVYTNIINCLDRDTNWFQLVKGDNIFAFDAETGSTNIQLRMENRMVYEGV